MAGEAPPVPHAFHASTLLVDEPGGAVVFDSSEEALGRPQLPRPLGPQKKILAFITEWNVAAHAFNWTPKSFEKVLAKVDSDIKAAA